MERPLVLVLALSLCAFTAADRCPQWQQWQAWSDCMVGKRDQVMAATDLDVSQLQLPPEQLMDIERFDHMCGNCAWRMRTRKRAIADDCEPCMEQEVQTCEEYMSICASTEPYRRLLFAGALPHCASLEHGVAFIRQCSAAVQTGRSASMIQQARRRFLDLLPSARCVHAGGVCKCCCEPYEPAPDGSECVMAHPRYECDPWSEYGQWSDKCMWFNTEPSMLAGIEQQCGVDFAHLDNPIISLLLKRETTLEAPDRCGYCSFRVKCRTRPLFDATGRNKVCFPLDVDKRSCGNDDCVDCGEPCTLPKVQGTCNYLDKIVNAAPGALRAIKKLPYTMSNGLMKMLTNLPFGKCVEYDGQCRCCCHPYTPSDDGRSCRVADVCFKFDAAAIDPVDGIETVLKLPPKEEL